MTDHREEEWRPIAGFEGAYEVSSLGRIRSLPRRVAKGGPPRRDGQPNSHVIKGRVRRLHVDRRGYLHVELRVDASRTTIKVHRAVCEAFHGPPRLGEVARHQNDECQDNRPENLVWGTEWENAQDAIRNGRTVTGTGAWRGALRAPETARLHELERLIAESRGTEPLQIAERHRLRRRCLERLRRAR